MAGPLVLVAAGGTGGHLFPAEALASALRPLGARVVLATDERVGGLADAFPAQEVVEIPSATPSGRSIPRMVLAAGTLGLGAVRALRELRRIRPDVVIGFGGYPTVPPLLAASLLGIPSALHEQNGVMGRANRFLAGRVSLLATGFAEVRGVPPGARGRRVHTGNPVRPAVIAAASRPFEPLEPGGRMRLLAFGGSQGARVMSDVVPAGVALLPERLRARLSLVQQARPEDLERVRADYAAAGVDADVQPFFRDLPARIAASHLVVSRSGASTVAELGVIGRPSILVPLPGAIDQDQAANAASLAAIGAGTLIPQPEFTPERLAAEIAERFEAPHRLTDAARAAKSAGIADAADRLAAALLDLAGPARPGQSGR